MREKRHAPDYLLLATIIVLVSVGVLMVFSASTSISHARFGHGWYYLRRQATFALLGSLAMYVASRVNYWKLQQLSSAGLIVSIVLLLLVFVPQVAMSSHGATRWIKLGPIPLQPSEVAKVTLALWIADVLARKGDKIKRFVSGSLPIMLVTGIICLMVVLQPDLGTAVAIAAIMGVMLFTAGMPLYQIGVLGALAGGALVAAIVVAPYRLVRVISFMNPWNDPSDTGYQIIQSLYAIGPGGIFGRGIGKSFQKQFFLPEPHNDFIFSVLAEELGFVGGMAVILLFAVLAVRGMRIALRAPDRFSSLLATGITAMIVSQAIVNLAVVTGSMPVTGIPLPLVSAGGSSLLIVMGALGILLNISKYCKG
jgi:cell division protein FtsW